MSILPSSHKLCVIHIVVRELHTVFADSRRRRQLVVEEMELATFSTLGVNLIKW